MAEEMNYDDGTDERRVQVRRDQDNFVVTIDDRPYTVQAELIGPGQLQITMNNKVYTCAIAQEGNRRFVFLDGKLYELRKIEKPAYTTYEHSSPADSTILSDYSEGDVISPMPGRIVKLLVQEGDIVESGQDLLIVEAMKMENRIKSPYSGRVTCIHFQEGDQISDGAPLMEIEPLKPDHVGKIV